MLSVVWISPVFDRTAQDVAQENTKGVLCAVDMQRIEDNMAVLGSLWGATPGNRRVWGDGDFLYEADIAAICARLEALRQAGKAYLHGFLPACVGDVPQPPLNHWHKLNGVERIVYELRRLVVENTERKGFAGELCAGQEIGLL